MFSCDIARAVSRSDQEDGRTANRASRTTAEQPPARARPNRKAGQKGTRARAVLSTVEDCGSYGVSVVNYDGTYAVANRNTVSGCTRGIYGGPSGEDNGNGLFALNTVTGNEVGMEIQDTSAIVGRNTANDNTQTGIYILYPGTLVRRNTAFGNGDFDINAPVGANDGGENRGTNCVNVTCGP